MRSGILLLVGFLALSGCGDDGDDGSQDESEDHGGKPICRSVDLTNSTAVEKVNAAMCFALAFDGSFGCQYVRGTDTTYCDNGRIGFYVTHRETPNGTVGDVHDQFDDSRLGQLRQSSTGLFVVDYWLEPRAMGHCSVTGDVATLCIDL